MKNIYLASRGLLKYLRTSTDAPEDHDLETWAKRTEIEELRRKADLIEARDAAIIKFRAAVDAFEEACLACDKDES